eukprot:15313743-Alexandrium_andersonii.AAC.1
MEAVCSQAVVAGRTVRGRGPALAHIGQCRISEDWANPVSEAGEALMESHLKEGDDFIVCKGCRCEVTTAYFVSGRDDAELSFPRDALREACPYALRFKRF